MVLPVGDQDVAGLVEGDAPGLVELALASAGLATFADELAFRGEDLQTVVAAVDDDEIAAALDCQTRRAIELAVTAAGRTPFADELAVAGEHRDRVGPFIRNIHLTLAIDGDAERPDAVPIAFAVLAKVGDPIFFARAAELHLIAVHPKVVFAAAVGGVEDAILTEAHGLDVIEPVAPGGAAPDRMTPIKDSSACNCCQRHFSLLFALRSAAGNPSGLLPVLRQVFRPTAGPGMACRGAQAAHLGLKQRSPQHEGSTVSGAYRFAWKSL